MTVSMGLVNPSAVTTGVPAARQAMSKPTPTTDTLSRYAATPPMGMVKPTCPSARRAARSARPATSESWRSVPSSWSPNMTALVPTFLVSIVALFTNGEIDGRAQRRQQQKSITQRHRDTEEMRGNFILFPLCLCVSV
ncbi:MAG: hypothetical protein AVDCRST_MAG89-3586 [uncultured Gemmatimonadetes bacterium]|uniref:Uncharacterized protein n=1 Tax=uncultured Gemmatimonadota bacterium TaxID=203437 RepID=A0A6J4MFZ6_9BACT|nr:MAG: hypothetical protein AVDCRST_MAG89-3586 [uncultured Gemmatimonadota bacterium]